MLNRKKEFIVLLLLLSCMASTIVLARMEPPDITRLHSATQLDSLITLTFDQHRISQQQIRTRQVQVDSLFSRKIYTVTVPNNFSKTSFHYNLHQKLWPYQARTSAKVEFPEKNLRIHVIVNGNVHRSLFINSE